MESVQKPKPRVRKARKKLEHKENGELTATTTYISNSRSEDLKADEARMAISTNEESDEIVVEISPHEKSHEDELPLSTSQNYPTSHHEHQSEPRIATTNCERTVEQCSVTEDDSVLASQCLASNEFDHLLKVNGHLDSSQYEQPSTSDYQTEENISKPETVTRSDIYPSLIADANTQLTHDSSGHSIVANVLESDAMEIDDSDLLMECQLFEYYSNPQLDLIDQFVNDFTQRELEPRNSLYSLLVAYKKACDKLNTNESSKAELLNKITKLNSEVWSLNAQKITHQGTCGCKRAGMGESMYNVGTLHPEKLVELKEDFELITKCELDTGFCYEIRARALALHIQWRISQINKEFSNDHQININSVPLLITVSNLPSRRLVLTALSDLFHFLRYPSISSRFRKSLLLWVDELVCHLLMASTSADIQFLLCHILRCPSPLADWAVSYVQTYIEVPSINFQTAMDNFVTLLALIMKPIRLRDHFLSRLAIFYEGDNAWDVVDDEGECTNASLIDLTESDLISLLKQFSFKALISTLLDQFSTGGNPHNSCLSCIAFSLTLIKLLDEGLQTHSKHKNFCKMIVENIKFITESCAQFVISKINELNKTDRLLIQNEVNRTVIQALCIISTKKTPGIRQFLVEFPYAIVSEKCRIRCQLILRNSSKYSTSSSVYGISDTDLMKQLKSEGSLLAQIMSYSLAIEDFTHTILTLASIVSQCDFGAEDYLVEIIDICFLNEITRDNYYKVGMEAISILIDQKSCLLSTLIHYIDRNVDHLDSYVVKILNNTSLFKCAITTDDVIIISKWLVNRSIEHPASHVARRILCSLNWGWTKDEFATQSLFIDQKVHDSCADAIVKAHIIHCKTRNSLISKSFSKAARLATKCSDQEQNFECFCWNVLVRLKISHDVCDPSAASPANDLTSYFQFIIRKCLSTPAVFLEKGLKYFIELVNSSSFHSSVFVLTRLLRIFPKSAGLFSENAIFGDAFKKILYADQTSYITQLVAGSSFPGPILTLLASAINYQVMEEQSETGKKELIEGWFTLLTSITDVELSSDKFVLYLIDTLTRSVFISDPDHLLGLADLAKNLCRDKYKIWKEAPKGLMSWFTTQIHPALISPELFESVPWAAYLMLKAENKTFSAYLTPLYDAMGKHPKLDLSECLKKANTKSSMLLCQERLPYFQWLQLCNSFGSSLATTSDSTTRTKVHPILPLSLQQLSVVMLGRQDWRGKTYCRGLRFFRSKQTEKMFKHLREFILLQAEKFGPKKESVFYTALLQWIWSEELLNDETIESINFENFNLNYLLELIIRDGAEAAEHCWTEFFDLSEISNEIAKAVKVYTDFCHFNISTVKNTSNIYPTPVLNSFAITSNFAQAANSRCSITTDLRTSSTYKNFPSLSSYQNNSFFEPDFVTSSGFFSHTPKIISECSRYLAEIAKAAQSYVHTKDSVEILNGKYLDFFQTLYTHVQRSINVSIKCGGIISSCPKPLNITLSVNLTEYDQKVADKMNENRRKREEELYTTLTAIDLIASNCAKLEYVCSVLACQPTKSNSFQNIALNLFYQICGSFNQDVQFLFPAAIECYEHCMMFLGPVFVRGNAAEQHNLARAVLTGTPMSSILVSYFTPHCLPPNELFSLYSELSAAIRNPETSKSAFSLLKCLDIQQAGHLLPSNQFSALMPVIFENILSLHTNIKSGTSSEELRNLCQIHFLHSMLHHFPQNFQEGLRLIMESFSKQLPASLLLALNKTLRVDETLSELEGIIKWSAKQELVTATPFNSLGPDQIQPIIQIVIEQLQKSRHDYGIRMYAVYAPYLEPLCRLLDFFLRLNVFNAFIPEKTTSLIEKELALSFQLVTSCFSPLLEPIPITAKPPWATGDNVIAEHVVEIFMQNLNWLPHSTYLPPGSESCCHLFWQYFANKLINDVWIKGPNFKYITNTYEKKIALLNWAQFWPNLLDFGIMEKLLCEHEGDNAIAPIIVEILIRINWAQLLQLHKNQPLDAIKTLNSLVLSILARCVQRQSYYAKSRASFSNLLILFFDFEWHFTNVSAIERVGKYMETTFPVAALVNYEADAIIKGFLNIWRETCFFTSTHKKLQITYDESDVAQKRAIFIRTNLAIVSRENANSDQLVDVYTDLINKSNLFLSSAVEPIHYLGMTRELISFWSACSETKFLDEAYSKLTAWLEQHPDSLLPLLFLNIGIDALKENEQIAFKFADDCIRIYFKRRVNCTWDEVLRWFNFPNSRKECLYSTPKSDSKKGPWLYLLYANLLSDMSRLCSATDELKLLMALSSYLKSLKPKYVTSDIALLLCVIKWQQLCIRQFTTNSANVTAQVANDNFGNYILWLNKVQEETKGVSLSQMFMRIAKPRITYSSKVQFICSVLNLFLNQQQTSVGQLPRLKSSPVLNSRIQAFTELKNQKLQQELKLSPAEYNRLFDEITPFFKQSDLYNLNHADQLFNLLTHHLFPHEMIFK